MKKSTILLSMLAAAVWLHGCTDGSEGARDNSPPATIDIASAREAFVRDYTAAIETRSAAQSDQRHYTLADTDFTPLWDLAVASENALIQSLDIPLLATTRCFSSDDGGKSMLQMRQKLVFVRQKGSQRITSYLLSLAFDPRCEHIADPDRIFIHAGDKSRFCGIAIYTDLGGRLVSVSRYDDGRRTDRLFAGDRSASAETKAIRIEEILRDTRFYLASTPYTRGGGGNPTFEGLCIYCWDYPCFCEAEHYPWFTVRCDFCGRYEESCLCKCQGCGKDRWDCTECEWGLPYNCELCNDGKCTGGCESN